MKKIAKILLIVIGFYAFQLSISTKESISKSLNSSAHAELSPQNIVDYLNSLGYSVIDLKCYFDKGVCYARTVYRGIDYLTTVYVQGDQIIGHDDVIFFK